jgi:hypothetical protein
MATKKKLLQAAAGNAGGAGLNVEDVFSTYLYDGNGSTQTITTNVDITTDGGMIWFKTRTGTVAPDHIIIDTERPDTGSGYPYLITNSSAAQATTETPFFAGSSYEPTSTGFTLGQTDYANRSNQTYASWTFRKAPKFFDVVTYTGDGAAGRTVSHNLGSVPGMILVKQTNAATIWPVYHKGVNGGTNPENYLLYINGTAAQIDSDTYWNDTAPTDSVFTVGTNSNVNASGGTYVAYLFAHNDGDGVFGPNGNADAIKCGSYTGNGSTTGPVIDLGFEPQWLLIRNTDRADDWVLIDSMRGIPSSSDGPAVLRPESSAAEYASGSTFSQASRVDLTATGFDVKSSNSRVNGGSQNMIYVAIRRPTAVPESATEVFAVAPRTNTIPGFASGFPVDFLIGARTINGADSNEIKTRLISGSYLRANTTGAETVSDQTASFAYNDGFFRFSGANANQYCWMWKRAPNFFDVVAYTGTGATPTVINHNLNVAPEMMLIKSRTSNENWMVYHSALGNTKAMVLTTSTPFTANTWNNTTPSATTFTLGGGGNNGSQSGQNYIAYLFATLAGISKVGSVTHSGTTNVDCGFSSGARFVLLKRTDATGDWYIWDSVRGIVSGNDPYLLLNSTAAEVTNTDLIDPLSSGFTITSSLTAGDYIFYAIA